MSLHEKEKPINPSPTHSTQEKKQIRLSTKANKSSDWCCFNSGDRGTSLAVFEDTRCNTSFIVKLFKFLYELFLYILSNEV